MIDLISKNKTKIIAFIFFITIISSITLFIIPEMTKGHDLLFHLSRIAAIKDNLKIGKIGGSIYFNYLNGYGYGNPLFYPDLFLYIPAILNFLGLNLITSYKMFIFLISFFSVFNMYLCVKNISKDNKSALISSFLYGFSSYRLVDTFTRAALGETLSFVFAPIIIWGIYEIIYGDYKKFYILVIGMSGLLLSHIISTYLIGILLLILCLVNFKKFWNEKKRIWYLILAAVLTLMLTAYFVFPMLEQMIDRKFFINNLDSTSQLAKRAVPLWGLFLEFPYHIIYKQWIPLGLGLGIILTIYWYFKNKKNSSSFTSFCFISAIVCMICSTNIFPWNLFQTVMSPIQFPWRLYFIVTLLLSIGFGLLHAECDILNSKKINILFIICLLPVLCVSVLNFFSTRIRDLQDYAIYYGEYLPEKSSIEYIQNRGETIDYQMPVSLSFVRDNDKIIIDFSNNESANNILELPLLYYKGYGYSIDRNDYYASQTQNGLVGVNLFEYDSGRITVYYRGTKIQSISKIISIVSLILFLMFIFLKKVVHYEE